MLIKEIYKHIQSLTRTVIVKISMWINIYIIRNSVLDILLFDILLILKGKHRERGNDKVKKLLCWRKFSCNFVSALVYLTKKKRIIARLKKTSVDIPLISIFRLLSLLTAYFFFRQILSIIPSIFLWCYKNRA